MGRQQTQIQNSQFLVQYSQVYLFHYISLSPVWQNTQYIEGIQFIHIKFILLIGFRSLYELLLHKVPGAREHPYCPGKTGPQPAVFWV